MIDGLKSTEITLSEGQIASAYNPFGKMGGYSTVYRNDGTRAIDKEFSLDGIHVIDKEMTDFLLYTVRGVENPQVASTLEFFIQLAINPYAAIVGVPEKELESQMNFVSRIQAQLGIQNYGVNALIPEDQPDTQDESNYDKLSPEAIPLLDKIFIETTIGAGYLVREAVESKDILFPVNIKPNIR